MRQILTRVDDDLHASIKAAARAQGSTINAFVVAALERATGAQVDARAVVRRRARDSGLLVVPPQPDEPRLRAEVLTATRGAGSSVGRALEAERDPAVPDASAGPPS